MPASISSTSNLFVLSRRALALARTSAAKRGGSAAYKLTLDEALNLPNQIDVDLVALDGALHELSQLDPQQSRIIELRFFAGLTIEETSEVLGISPATVKRDWTSARAWLHREITRSPAE